MTKKDEKFIKRFQINIGQPAMMGLTVGDAFLQFIINDHSTTFILKDFKDWVNDIYESQGNRSEKSYKAKKELDSFFINALWPWIEHKTKE